MDISSLVYFAVSVVLTALFIVLCINVSIIRNILRSNLNHEYWKDEFRKQQFLGNSEKSLQAYMEMIWIDVKHIRDKNPDTQIRVQKYEELKIKYVSLEHLGGVWPDGYFETLTK